MTLDDLLTDLYPGCRPPAPLMTLRVVEVSLTRESVGAMLAVLLESPVPARSGHVRRALERGAGYRRGKGEG